MAECLGTRDVGPILEYILNNASVWEFPSVENETLEHEEEKRGAWEKHLVYLDTALLSLLGTEDVSIDEIANSLDLILQSSLWQRKLNRNVDELKTLFNSVLELRGKHIWNVTTARQRKGYFLAGVGLETGQRLDAISQNANVLLINANIYIASNDWQSAVTTITSLAELVFEIPPFVPRNLPDDWKDILTAWLSGETLTECNFIDIDNALKFIEDGMIYRLPWGLEAIKVRAQANEDIIADENTINDYELGLVVPAIENGTLNRSAALLMQAGFNSRQAAIYAINSTNATFSNGREFKAWLKSEQVEALTETMVWPTQETSSLWIAFKKEYQPKSHKIWGSHVIKLSAVWSGGVSPPIGSIVKISNNDNGVTKILSSDGEQIGILNFRYKLIKSGVYYTRVAEGAVNLDVTYWGPGKEPFGHSDHY